VIIHKKFYQRETLIIAQELLGCYLVRKIGKKTVRGMICETEAYIGEDDLACHASRGRTPRTEIMYGEAGHAYVYMIYGMYHCLNVVTEKKDFPADVLIRGLANIEQMASDYDGWYEIKNIRLNGPGKLCKFLKIDRKLNGWDVTKGEKLWIEKSNKVRKVYKVKKSKRVGVDYAKHCKDHLWRFNMLVSASNEP
jgi:DNA-3-methyladenine glycosylase